MTKTANFFVAHNVDCSKDTTSVRRAFLELFKERGIEINMASGKSGEIKAVKSISQKNSDYLHSYTFLFVKIDRQDSPSDNWEFMCFHDNESKTICIGDANSKNDSIKEWSISILNCLINQDINTDYSYSYHETIPFGQGYAVGVFCEDDEHDITDFDTAEEISLWLKNGNFDPRQNKIRDIFDVNIFSTNLFKEIINFFDEAAKKFRFTHELNSGFHLISLNDSQKQNVRAFLEKNQLLIAKGQGQT